MSVAGTDPDASTFQAIIDELIVRAAGTAASFDDLLRRLPGVWPPAVRQALTRQVDTGLLHEAIATRLEPHPSTVPPRSNGAAANNPAPATTVTGISPPHEPGGTADHGIWLPPPHPLDYDWRFSERTVAELLDRCVHQTRLGEAIALLGTPSVLRGALQRRLALARRFVLLDRSHATTARLAVLAPTMVIACDLATDPLPRQGSLTDTSAIRLVIADPPWYSRHVQAFLWVAAQLTTTDGRVLLSLPAVGTRPGVLLERAADLAFAEQVGLELVDQQPSALEYVSPPFERQALAAAGLGGISPTWRRGDLVELRRTGKPTGRRPPPPEEPWWAEVDVGVARMRFVGAIASHLSSSQQEEDAPDASQPALVDPRLFGLVPGDVLATVSP